MTSNLCNSVTSVKKITRVIESTVVPFKWIKSQKGQIMFFYEGNKMRLDKKVNCVNFEIPIGTITIKSYKCSNKKVINAHKNVCHGRCYLYFNDQNELIGFEEIVSHDNCDNIIEESHYNRPKIMLEPIQNYNLNNYLITNEPFMHECNLIRDNSMEIDSDDVDDSRIALQEFINIIRVSILLPRLISVYLPPKKRKYVIDTQYNAGEQKYEKTNSWCMDMLKIFDQPENKALKQETEEAD